MKVMAADGRGFIAVPSISHADAIARYGYQIIGKADTCRIHFHAITAERRIEHPAVSLITSKARVMLQG
jgi:LysR family transcriptional activator of nhaA